MNNEDQLSRLIAATKATTKTQQAYTGRIIQRETVTVQDEQGNPIQKEIDVYLTWDTIKEVLSLIRARAGL